MSDRHICKAKRADNGEWVEGYFFEFEEKSYVTCLEETIVHAIYTEEPSVKDFNMRAFEVDPSTLCQCTGSPDKNRKKIFERDVIRREQFGKYILGEVVWLDIGFCGFHLKCGNSFYPIGKDEDTGLSDCDEIIGNIFDNPELLEGGAE